MRLKILAIAAAAAATLASSPASALTVVQPKTFDALAAGVATAFSFDQFDANLGTLDSVTLDFTFLMPDVSGTVKNTGRNARDFTVKGSASGSVVGQGFNLSDTSDVVTKVIASLASGATAGVGPFGGAGDGSSTLTGDLAAFIGTGDLNYLFSRGSTFQLIPAGQGMLTMAPTISGTATLTYNYTAPPPVVVEEVPPIVEAVVAGVPEPASWALMIMGFGGMGAMLRHRKLALARA